MSKEGFIDILLAEVAKLRSELTDLKLRVEYLEEELLKESPED